MVEEEERWEKEKRKKEKRGRFLILLSRKEQKKKSLCPSCKSSKERKAGRLWFRHEKPTSLEATRFSIECDSNEA